MNRTSRLLAPLVRFDPGAGRAEPITPLFLVAFAAFMVHAVVTLVRHRLAPGMDAPYHAFCIGLVSDRGRDGSLYTALYEPLHLTEPNTLLYAIAAPIARVVGPIDAYRIVSAWNPLGVPLATLWALRRFGRSAWGTLFAFPLAYTQTFMIGYTPFGFAAPAFIVALCEFWFFLERPTRRVGIFLAVLLVVVFLTHAHVWLWLGALLATMTLVRMWRVAVFEKPARALARGVIAFVVAAPSLALFAKWYAATYAVGRVHGRVDPGASVGNLYRAEWQPILHKIQWGFYEVFHITRDDPRELGHLVLGAFIVVFALVVARSSRDRRVPVLELCALVSFASYFILPDTVSEQGVATRQLDMGGWLAPILVTPPSLGSVSRLARSSVIGLLVVFGVLRLALVDEHLTRFDEQIHGLEVVGEKVPYRGGLIAFATMDWASDQFAWASFFHVAGWIAAEKGLEMPVYKSDRYSNRPIRYIHGAPAPPTRIVADPNWPDHEGLWDDFDYVLVRGWMWTHPSEEAIAGVRRRAELVAESGDFQLWHRRSPTR